MIAFAIASGALLLGLSGAGQPAFAAEASTGAPAGEPAEAGGSRAPVGASEQAAPVEAAQAPAAPAGAALELEHVVIGTDADSAYLRVMEVFRTSGRHEARIPLIPGHQAVELLTGPQDPSLRLAVEGDMAIVSRVGDPPQEDSPAAGAGETPLEAALTYRVLREQVPHPYARPVMGPVGRLFVFVHPSVSLAVGGLGAAGEVELQGTTYQAYLGQDLQAGDQVFFALTGAQAGGAQGPAARSGTGSLTAPAAGVGILETVRTTPLASALFVLGLFAAAWSLAGVLSRPRRVQPQQVPPQKPPQEPPGKAPERGVRPKRTATPYEPKS